MKTITTLDGTQFNTPQQVAPIIRDAQRGQGQGQIINLLCVIVIVLSLIYHVPALSMLAIIFILCSSLLIIVSTISLKKWRETLGEENWKVAQSAITEHHTKNRGKTK